MDNTWATPLLQKPFELGADIAVHSLTKYIAGHSDVLGGAVICRANDDVSERIRAVQTMGGGCLDPFSAWLTLRGVRSLSARLPVQCASAMAVAKFLQGHSSITRVHYPGLAAHPGHAVAARQMRLFGGMLSFEIVGGRDEALAFAARLRVFTRATSLGGTESLVEHRASVEAPSATPESLLRLSIGLEHPDDLVEDLRRALDKP